MDEKGGIILAVISKGIIIILSNLGNFALLPMGSPDFSINGSPKGSMPAKMIPKVESCKVASNGKDEASGAGIAEGVEDFVEANQKIHPPNKKQKGGGMYVTLGGRNRGKTAAR